MVKKEVQSWLSALLSPYLASLLPNGLIGFQKADKIGNSALEVWFLKAFENAYAIKPKICNRILLRHPTTSNTRILKQFLPLK
jgi:hypothetical protein